VRGKAAGGRLTLSVPLRGIERFSVRFALEPSDGLGAARRSHRVAVPWKRLAAGSRSRLVSCVLRRLADLRIRVPGGGRSFTPAVGDAVVAFQKTYRLPRTYAVGYRDWRRLESAVRPRPRYPRPSAHLEIDRSRQILSVIREGRVLGVVPVSTGASGITPRGSFWIERKLYVNRDPVFMPRFMYFHRTMGIHGYPSVPPYPASHGCVREPLWVAGWVYDRAFVGERLYIY
jgi:hypothetical protein